MQVPPKIEQYGKCQQAGPTFVSLHPLSLHPRLQVTAFWTPYHPELHVLKRTRDLFHQSRSGVTGVPVVRTTRVLGQRIVPGIAVLTGLTLALDPKRDRRGPVDHIGRFLDACPYTRNFRFGLGAHASIYQSPVWRLSSAPAFAVRLRSASSGLPANSEIKSISGPQISDQAIN